MQALGDQLLARSSLADDEDWAIERSGAARPLDGVEEGKALSDELLGPLHGSLLLKNLADCWWQIPPFGKDFQALLLLRMAEIPKDSTFHISGTPVAWL
jgi:hypothetical protein